MPLLAKGFFSERAELEELRRLGADAVLLLLRDLDDAQTRKLMAAAQELGLDTLVEAHDAEELRRAVELDAAVIGINARDLSTFAIDRRAQLELVESAPRDRVVVAESAIAARAHGAEAELAGADAVLVGSTLMLAADPAAKLQELLARPLVKVCGLTREEDVAAAAEAGADLAGFVLARETPRRASRVLPCRKRCSRSPFTSARSRTTAPTSSSSTRARTATARATACCCGAAARWPASSTGPGSRRTRAISTGRAPPQAGSCSPAGSRPRTSTRRSCASGRGPWTQARASRGEPGVKDHDRIRAYVEAARC